MIEHLQNVKNPTLSILICSLKTRKRFLDNLIKILKPQLQPNVEIIINTDNKELSIGTKRNQLLDAATAINSEFIAFIDDDDRVHPQYVKKILTAISSTPAPVCIGMEGEIRIDRSKPKIFIHSNRYDHWFEENNKYFRCCNHLNPIKTELAMQVRFPEINMGEDHDYSNRLAALLKDKVEKYIDGPIYYYDYVSNK